MRAAAGATAHARLRHNHAMRHLPTTFLLLMATLLAACDAPPPRRVGAPVVLPGPDSALEFAGQRPCADCLGIEAWLRLELRDGVQRYRMVERYRGMDRERRFEDAGTWSSQGDLLRLASDAGGERVYVRSEDGGLQARASGGGELPEARDEVLVPVGYGRSQ